MFKDAREITLGKRAGLRDSSLGDMFQK